MEWIPLLVLNLCEATKSDATLSQVGDDAALRAVKTSLGT